MQAHDGWDAPATGRVGRWAPRSVVATVSLALALALATGPAATSEPEPTAAAPGSFGIHGTWLIDGYQAAGGPYVSPVIVTERAPEITFNVDGSFWGYTGCNGFSGDALIDGGTIELGEVSMTIMYCGEGAAAMQEAAILGVVDAATGWRSEPGTLQLTGPSGVVLLAGSAVDASVVGAWVLRRDPPSDTASASDERAEWRLTMAADGSLFADAGCDPISGTYVLDGMALHFEVVAGTRASCGEAVDANETALLEALEPTVAYAVNPYRLTLLDVSGAILADFHVSEESG